MTLKILRLEVWDLEKFAEKFGFVDMLKDIANAEILNAYQYDNFNIFSLQRIRFKPNRIASLDTILRENLKVEYYELLNQQNDEVLCILKQRRDTGFFNLLDQGPWAFLFPITIGADLAQLQFLAEEQYLSKLYDVLAKFTDSYRITNVSNVIRIKDLDKFGQFQMTHPNFSARQREIATYAGFHGYFESPKRITGRAIANNFGITTSAVNIHLKRAENLAMKYFFGGTNS